MGFGTATVCLAVAVWASTSTGTATVAGLDPPFAVDEPWDASADLGAEQSVFGDETPMITGASRRRQTLAEVPASVSVITAEQIRVHGWSSLGEILSHVRGFYVADDLNYGYVGVRGFMRPGDYNSRVLLLIDGHPINDPVFLATSVGREIIDPSHIERVEVIRGPGSALYGSAALLGVINVVTRTGPDSRGLDGVGAEIALSADSLGRADTSLRFDRWIGDQTRLAIAVGAFGGLGQRYDFPELGLAGLTERDQDREGGLRVFGRFEHGPLSIVAGYSDRIKNVPTGSFGTLPEGLTTRDGNLYVSGLLQLELAPGAEWSSRLAVAHSFYEGTYPYAETDGGELHDFSRGTLVTLESTLVAELDRAVVIHGGISGQRSFLLDTWSAYPGMSSPSRDLGYGTLGFFVDVQLRLIPGLSVFSGARLDLYETFGSHASPRLALVAEPWSGMVLRGSYGTAFRAPNAFELYYVDVSAAQAPRVDDLRPELLEQLELSAEQTLYDGRAHIGVALFTFEMRGLIDAVADDGLSIGYVNAGTARARGGELWADLHLPLLDARVEASYSASFAQDVETGVHLSASPIHLVSGTTDLSLGIEGLRLALAARYISERRGIESGSVPGALIIDSAVSWRDLAPGLDLSLGVKNTFDTTWWVPGSVEHALQRLPQEGISAWVRLSSVF